MTRGELDDAQRLLQYLRGCVALAGPRNKDNDGLAYVAPSKLAEAIAIIERAANDTGAVQS